MSLCRKNVIIKVDFFRKHPISVFQTWVNRLSNSLKCLRNSVVEKFDSFLTNFINCL